MSFARGNRCPARRSISGSPEASDERARRKSTVTETCSHRTQKSRTDLRSALRRPTSRRTLSGEVVTILVRGHYNAKLTVMNIGDNFTTGPKEAAYVINELVKPNAVIASHVNEVATKGGKVLPGTKTETFIKAVKVPVHLPLSGRTMSFDSAGKCVAGC